MPNVRGHLQASLSDGAFTGVTAVAENGVETSLLSGNSPVRDVNTAFVLLSGYLVFFMHCGFAMLSIGAVRSKNAKNIALKIVLDACFGALAWYVLGYGFGFGGTYGDTSQSNAFIGYNSFALHNVPKEDYHHWFFEYAFAATSATIVSGAVAERCKFEAYIIYCSFLVGWVYPLIVHWLWTSDGWASATRTSGPLLFGTGVMDFAGDSPVHMIGGLAGLAGAAILGPRIGRFTAEGKPNDMPGHNTSLAVLGVFILWFGWYGFNPGSTLAIIDKANVSSLAVINTTLAPAAGTIMTLLVMMIVELRQTGHITWDLVSGANGTLAGLVGITGGCAVMEPWAAIITGGTAGCVYCFASWLILYKLKIDDPLDAGAVHAFCGAWGLLCASAFAYGPNVAAAYSLEVAAAGQGFFMSDGNGRMLAAAIVFILVTIGWTLGHMVPFFFLMKYTGLFRVSADDELEGLDRSHHGGSAYHDTHSHAAGMRMSGSVYSHKDGKYGFEPDNGKSGQSGNIGGAAAGESAPVHNGDHFVSTKEFERLTQRMKEMEAQNISVQEELSALRHSNGAMLGNGEPNTEVAHSGAA